jgi:signal transduction histidine kinase
MPTEQDPEEGLPARALPPSPRDRPSGGSRIPLSPDFRAFADASPDLFCYCSAVRDEAGKVVFFRLEYVNAAALDANGGTCAGQGGRCVFELLLARRENGLFERCREVVESGQPCGLDRLPVDYVEDGVPVRRWFSFRATKLGDGFVGTGREVGPEPVRDRPPERIERLLAMLSHELRAPLAPILLAAAALERDESLSPEARRRAASIRRNATLESRLVEDLLDLARVERGKLALDRRPTDLREAVQEALETSGADLAAKGVRLEVDFGPAGPQLLEADPLRLRQALWNLLGNALKFTPPGGAVRVTSRREGGEWAVEVADTGIGIEASRLPHVFDPFEQGSAEITRLYGGLGVGLAISKAMVEAHGGTLTAASAGPGHGATFTVRLPAA